LNELFEIVQLIKAGKITFPHKIIPSKDFFGDKTYQFYKGLESGKYSSDEQAREDLYGLDRTKANHVSHAKFNVLKKRLKERLFLNVLFPVEGQYPADGYQASFLFCNRNYIISRLMIFFGATLSGYKLMRKVLDKAEKYQIYEIAQLSANSLLRDAVQSGNQKQFKLYRAKLKEFQKVYSAETEADGLYYQLLIPFAKQLYVRVGTLEHVHSAMKAIENLYNEFKTHKLFLSLSNIQILYYQVKGENRNAIDICNQTLRYLESEKIAFSQVRMSNYMLLKMDAMLALRNYDLSAAYAKECIERYPEGSSGWFDAHELQFLCCINTSPLTDSNQNVTQKLNEASGIYLTCTSSKYFKVLKPAKQERWQIFGGYLWFLCTYYTETGILNEVFQDIPKFRLSKLINSTKIASMDKKGMNVSLLVLQFLICLQERKSMDLLKSVESIKYYISDNLRGEVIRERTFLKYLVALGENELGAIKNSGRITKIVSALDKTEDTLTPTQAQTEIISYRLLTDLLKSKYK